MIHNFETAEDATNYANRFGLEVYRLKNYVVMTAAEADELVEAGIPLTIASPEDEGGDLGVEDNIDPDHFDESMDGDHESALESVYGPDNDDVSYFDEPEGYW